MKIIAKTLEGLEDVLAEELRQLGAEEILVLKRAVSFSGNNEILYRGNLWLRTCLKLLVFVREFSVTDEQGLYEEIKKMPWETWMDVDDTLAIDSVVNSTLFRHSNYISLKTKDAIADRFREKYGRRPNVDTVHPTLRINIHIRETIVTVSLDSSGQSLHMRGYRKSQVEAPLSEVLAAGLVLLSEWDQKRTFIDPMCGSGTILCEAALLAAGRPPHSTDRQFAFTRWKHFDEVLWRQICDKAAENYLSGEKPVIKGFDISGKATSAAKENIAAAGLQDWVDVQTEDFFFQEGMQEAHLVFNPPYDGRLKEKDIMAFYQHIGDKLKLSFSNCTAWILSGHLEAIKHLGLRPGRRIKLLNGSIPSVFCRYDLYAGSKKAKWQSTDEKNA